MDWDHIQRNWKTMRTNVREKWGELTAKDLDFIAGQRAKLERKIRERYGFAADHVKKEVDDWARWQPEEPSRLPAPVFFLDKRTVARS